MPECQGEAVDDGKDRTDSGDLHLLTRTGCGPNKSEDVRGFKSPNRL